MNSSVSAVGGKLNASHSFSSIGTPVINQTLDQAMEVVADDQSFLLFDPIFKTLLSCYSHKFYSDAYAISVRFFSAFKCNETRLLKEVCCGELHKKQDNSYVFSNCESLNLPKHTFFAAKRFFDLKQYSDAKKVLLKNNSFDVSILNDESFKNYYGDSYPFVLNMLGQIFIHEHSLSNSIKCLERSFALNPLIFSTFECLSKIMRDIPLEKYFSNFLNVLKQKNHNDLIIPNQELNDLHLINFLPINTLVRSHLAPIENKNILNPPQSVSKAINKPEVKAEKILTPFKSNFGRLSTKKSNMSGIYQLSNDSNDFSLHFNSRLRSTPVSENHNQSFFDNANHIGSNSFTRPFSTRKTNFKHLHLEFGAETSNSNIFESGKKVSTNLKSNRNFASSSIKENSPLADDLSFKIDLKHPPLRDMQSYPSKLQNQLGLTLNEKLDILSNHLINILSSIQIIYESKRLFSNSMYKKAKKILKTLTKNEFNSPEIQYMIFQCKFYQKKYYKSAIIYQSIIDNDKHWLEGADLYSSALFFQTDYNMLGYFATRMKQFFFLNEQTWVAISNLYGLKSDKKNQTIALQRAIQLNPNYAYAHMLLGCQHYEANNFDKALECFKQCLINDPLFYLYWNMTAQCMLALNRIEEAKVYFQKALFFNKNDSDIYCNQAALYLQISEYAFAEKILLKATEINPTDHKVQFQLAKANYLLRNYEKSNDILNLLKKKVNSISVFVLLYLNYKSMGKESECKKYYTKAKLISEEQTKSMILDLLQALKQNNPNNSYDLSNSLGDGYKLESFIIEQD